MDDRATLDLRPEHIRLAPGANGIPLPMRVEAIEALGHSTYLYGRLATGSARAPASPQPANRLSRTIKRALTS